MDRVLQKYLKTRAVASDWRLAGLGGDKRYRAAVVIPALAESESLSATLFRLTENPASHLHQTLIVVVVNNRPDGSELDRSDNARTLEWLQAKPCPQLDLAWVDASSAGLELPQKEGVGLARKIGFDMALTQLDWRNDPLLISLDADTLVDSSYLAAIFSYFSGADRGAAVIPFRHQVDSDPAVDRAIREYELYLRSYLFGLQFAGSPYAYHTIGSAFACRAGAYVAAGGMNRRHAGEDFYFLQQLARVGGVGQVHGTVVHPSPRFSRRVPFGTGRAVQAQVQEGSRLFSLVSAESFRVLKDWLELIEASPNRSAKEISDDVQPLSAELALFLSEIGFVEIWSRFLQQHRSDKQRLKAFHDWFDALKTRQLLTRLDRDCRQSDEAKVEALLGWGGFSECTTRELQLERLEQLQLR